MFPTPGGNINVRRCSACAINWPVTAEYAKCPGCEMNTSVIVGDPMDPAEAKSLAAQYRFNQYLEHESEANRLKREAEVDIEIQATEQRLAQKREERHRLNEVFDAMMAATYSDQEKATIASLELAFPA